MWGQRPLDPGRGLSRLGVDKLPHECSGPRAALEAPGEGVLGGRRASQQVGLEPEPEQGVEGGAVRPQAGECVPRLRHSAWFEVTPACHVCACALLCLCGM